MLFYEYFHGDSGRGVGASHQTGWTGLVAKLLQPRRREAEQPKPRTTEMRKMIEDENLPPVVMPSCEVRKVLAGPEGAGHRRQLRHRQGRRASALGKAGADVVVNYVSGAEQAEEVVGRDPPRGRQAPTPTRPTSARRTRSRRCSPRCSRSSARSTSWSTTPACRRTRRFEEMTLEQWNTVIGVNLTGQFLCAREAVREFKRRGVRAEVSCAAGKIICISSVHEVIPWAGHVNYAASKGGVMLMMKSIAQEVAPHRIRVNSVCPGAIRTPINTAAWSTPEAYAELMKLVPYKRIGEVDDIGRAAVWLASDEADYITGASIFVDGGMTLYPGFEAGG